MEELKTGYEWGIHLNEIIIDLNKWDEATDFNEIEYYKHKMPLKFYIHRSRLRTKKEGRPIKPDKYLEYIMYGFVPYQLGGIHKGIQFGHAKDTLADILTGENLNKYLQWRKFDKTYIIKSGGTTNDTLNNYGGMQKCRDVLQERGVLYAEFREPDLADALTGLAFLVDERVWNTDIYPDFKSISLTNIESLEEYESYKEYGDYKAWVERLGGETNVFLRTWLKEFRLA